MEGRRDRESCCAKQRVARRLRRSLCLSHAQRLRGGPSGELAAGFWFARYAIWRHELRSLSPEPVARHTSINSEHRWAIRCGAFAVSVSYRQKQRQSTAGPGLESLEG